MPGHAFDDQMMIDANDGCLTPSGPLGLAAGETVLRLDIWIYQPSAPTDSQRGAACMAFLPSAKGEILPAPPPAPQEGWRWKMHPASSGDHFGNRFKPGAAIGMGLLVKKVEATGEIIVEQWNSPINLVDK